MRKYIFVLLLFLLVGCGYLPTTTSPSGQISTSGIAVVSPTIANFTPTSVPTSAPTSAPTYTNNTTTLQNSYLYVSDTTVIFLDILDQQVYRAETNTRTDVNGNPCVQVLSAKLYPEDITQNGMVLTINNLYVYNAPFFINADGTLTTHEADTNTGAIITEVFKPASVDAYNIAVKQLEKKMPVC